MSWDLGVLKGEIPAGSTSVADMVGEPLPLGPRGEVDAVLAELFPGYVPSQRDDVGGPNDVDSYGFYVGGYAMELTVHGNEVVTFVSFTPRINPLLAIRPMLAFADRFSAHLFDFSDSEILDEESAQANWDRFRTYRDGAVTRWRR